MTDKITTEQAIELLTLLYQKYSWDKKGSEALDMAIEALKLHIPTKPNWQGEEKCMDAYCPNCGAYLDDGENPCDGCTQLIDWGDEE